MDYRKIYDDLMKSRQVLNRKKLKRGEFGYKYYENHHIIPKRFGGSNKKENLVLLTGQEHFLAHKLLVHCFEGWKQDKMIYAVSMLASRLKGTINMSAKEYERIREEFAETISKEFVAHSVSDKTKEKLSKANKGKTYELRYGVEEAEQRKKVLSVNALARGIKQTKEWIDKRTKKIIGRKVSDLTKQKFSLSRKGKKTKPHSDKTKEILRAKALNRKVKPETVLKRLATFLRKGYVKGNYYHTEEYKKILSERFKSESNPSKKPENRKKQSERMMGAKNLMHNPEIKAKALKSRAANPKSHRKRKSLEEEYGIEKAAQIRKKMSDSAKKRGYNRNKNKK